MLEDRKGMAQCTQCTEWFCERYERIPHHKKLLRAVQVGVRVLNNDRFATYDRLLELWYLGQVRV